MRSPFHLPPWAWTFGVLALAACEADLPSAAAPAAAAPGRDAKVLARVDGEAITQRQLHRLAEEQPAAEAQARLLERLIDRQLLARRALDAQLERNPEVSLRLDMARQQVLAQAAAEWLAGPPRPPGVAEVRSYFEQHPAFFAERQIYRMQAFAVLAGRLDGDLRRALARSRRPGDTRAALAAGRVAFQERPVELVPEQLPPALAEQLVRLAVGDVLLVGQGGDETIYQLIDRAPAPVHFEAAQTLIRQYLASAERERQLAEQLARLRREARVEYLVSQPGRGQAALPATPAS